MAEYKAEEYRNGGRIFSSTDEGNWMNKIFCLLHILKERSSYMNKALRLFVVFLQEIESNGGCCLTHVNMRCLGDFAENELAASGL